MVVPINATGTIGIVIAGMSQNVFGSYDLALLFLLLICLAMCAAFRIPFEYSAILVLPLGLAMAWWNAQIWSFVGVLLLYAGIMLFKYFPIKVG